MTFLTKEDANRVALNYLTKLEQEVGEPLGLVNTETLDKPFGWVFFYNSKAYLDTGDIGSMLGGNAPFIVNRNTGEVFVTGTIKPVEDYIADYESDLA